MLTTEFAMGQQDAGAQSPLLSSALKYNEAGFSIIPIDCHKRPALKTWKPYQSTKPTRTEITSWFSSPVFGMAIIAGKIGGNLELIDVDCKYDPTGNLWSDFKDLIIEHAPELYNRLVIAQTVNRGFHILFRHQGATVEGNRKFAKRPTTEPEREAENKVKGSFTKSHALIETRGEGGYFAVSPTPGYTFIQGDLLSIPTITDDERFLIYTLARSFDQMPVEAEHKETQAKKEYAQNGLSPFEDYNERADIPALLQDEGWRVVSDRGNLIQLKRPGETGSKQSATFFKDRKIFYVFSTSTEFNSEKGYNPAGVYTCLKHGGDFSAAAKQLYVEGYGKRLETPPKSQANSERSQIAQNYKLVNPDETDAVYTKAGVWFNKDESRFWVCPPIKVVAVTRTEDGNNYGRYLQWTDAHGFDHSFAMPIELIHSEGNELMKYLANRGLDIQSNRKAYDHLKNYINYSKPDKTVINTDKIGWKSGAFVLPNEVFGGDFEIAFQTEYDEDHKFNVKGTLEEWRENVSRYCAGNSRLVFAESAAFACPLLEITKVDGGGFGFRGKTSTGKTTAVYVGGSVWGGREGDNKGFTQGWRATINGFEGIARNHNHALLCLDEIGECDTRDVGKTAYLLANGYGRMRMARSTALRKSASWHLLFLSSGERRLSDIMREAGQRTRAGQEIRLCDIEADSGKYGMFENLHGCANGLEFANRLKENSLIYYGTAIRAFLRKLVEQDREAIQADWREFQDSFFAKLESEKIINGEQPGEVLRVASRFALCAYAGEMATVFGITGWSLGEAIEAACDVFRVWLNGWQGNGNSDAEKAISQVRLFLEKHGQSRFQLLGDYSLEAEKIVNHAGYKRVSKDGTGKTEYLIFPETFRAEVCIGYDSTITAGALAERGFLEKASDGKNSKPESIGNKKQRFYVVNSNIFSDET
jgi:uncharacterized protein (DUF927 family)